MWACAVVLCKICSVQLYDVARICAVLLCLCGLGGVHDTLHPFAALGVPHEVQLLHISSPVRYLTCVDVHAQEIFALMPCLHCVAPRAAQAVGGAERIPPAARRGRAQPWRAGLPLLSALPACLRVGAGEKRPPAVRGERGYTGNSSDRNS